MSKRILVIGGGPGGYVAAIRAAQLGAEVTLVEREHLGGTCLNVGCIPTKCLLHSAELLEELRSRGPALGISAGTVQLDFSKVMANKRTVSRKLSNGVAGLLRANGVVKIDGQAAFTAPRTMEVTKSDGTKETLAADGIILATGSVNTAPPIPGLRENPNCIDSTGALALEELPKTMAVIGGGVIGLELACAYAAFGTQVTVIEALDHILPMLDADLTAVGMKRMKKLGIKVLLNHPVQAVEDQPSGARVICQGPDGAPAAVEAEKVLVAVGRRANTASLCLEDGGVAHDQGRILVNARMETNVPGVYAIGDCVMGHAQLAHTASAMGETAAENAMGGASGYDERTCPTCVYILPEAASVGLTEAQCRAQNLDYTVGKFPMAANGKALILNGGEGLVKILAERESGKVLGMHIIGPRATDLIAEGAISLRMGASLEDLISTIHSHPTVTEAVREAALSAEGRAIHFKG